jgi:hypothetical protein
MTTIDADYLVVGAGATGMAFTDALIADSDARVVMVDRRYRPGGHWNNAYGFVRLHQPAAFYGVNSRVLGTDSIDERGPNAGMYERVTAAEVCDYFQRVLDDHLLASGRVQFFGMCDYTADGPERRFVSRLTGETTTVRVRRKIVDATYLETPIPSTHTPSFSVDADARLIPVNGLVGLTEAATRYTVIGAGKTAMDACVWLLDNGVAAGAIRWIRPRDAWLIDRAHTQPLALVASVIESASRGLECAAEAESVTDLFRRLDACGELLRIDPTVEPTMYRCATVSTGELEKLRAIENVVRKGRVVNIGAGEVALEEGSIPACAGEVFVDCTAAGLRVCPARPIFEADRITLQQVRTCQPTFNAALVGYLEAVRADDAEKNRLCPPNPYPDSVTDWMAATAISQRAQNHWNADPELMAWMEGARLNAARGIGDHLTEPRMASALNRMFTYAEPAVANLERLTASMS